MSAPALDCMAPGQSPNLRENSLGLVHKKIIKNFKVCVVPQSVICLRMLVLVDSFIKMQFYLGEFCWTCKIFQLL